MRTRHLIIEGPAVRTFCSQHCATTPLSVIVPPEPPRRRSPLRHIARVAVGLPMLVFTSGYTAPHPIETAAPMVVAAPVAPPEPASYGPAWPPTEKDWIAE
ncbi:MAG: hypothetical protein ACXVDD_11200, partial [Polyangia bacterium]